MQRHGQIGDYYLTKRANSPYWCKTWFDATTRQTRRESLGIENLDEAIEALHSWYALNVVLRDSKPEDVKLADVLHRYWLDHGSTVASKSSIRVHLLTIIECLEDDISVADFKPRRQEALIAALRARGLADGTIKRTWATMRAAVTFAWRQEIITQHPPLINGLPDGEPRETTLTIREMAKLWDAFEFEHLRAFSLVCIGTMCRPGAALELTRDACNLDRRLITLNPAGRTRTKKRRPIVPMARQLIPWIEATADGERIVQWKGAPVTKLNKAFRHARSAAGLPDDVTPYAFRHSMATELNARGVPEGQVAQMLGHTTPSNKSTARYAKFRPDYLREARQCIETIIEEIASAASRPLVPAC